MKKLRELLSDTLIYGISSVLARFINYLLVPLHTKVYDTAQYGVVGLVYAAIAFLNVVFTFGMESAYLRYAKDRKKAQSVFKTIQLALLAMATLLALLLWMFSPVVMPLIGLEAGNGNQDIFLLMIGILWFDTLSIIPFAELRLVRKSLQFAVIRMTSVVIMLGLNMYLIWYLDWGIEAIFIANLIASGAATIYLWILTAPMMAGEWSHPVLTKALRFGLPFVPAGIGYAINEMLDRFFLKNYMTDETAASLYGEGTTALDVVGLYNASYKMAVFMLLIIQMFRMAWQPFFLRHADDEDAPELYADVFLYFNLAAGIAFLGVALFVTDIVRIPVPIIDGYLIDPKFWSGLYIVPVLLGAYWFHGWYMNFSAGVFIKEETRILPQIMLFGAVVTIVTNLIMIPYFGMMGAAWSTLISYASMAFMLYYQIRKVYPVPYPMLKVGLMMGWVVACLLSQPAMHSWVGTGWLANGMLLLAGVSGLFLITLRGRYNIKG